MLPVSPPAQFITRIHVLTLSAVIVVTLISGGGGGGGGGGAGRELPGII
jgi:hypothetical protein